MKKIVNLNRTPILLDSEDLKAQKLESIRYGIDSMYVVPEDATIHWESAVSDNVYDEEVKANDIIITFYDTKYPKDYVVIHSDEWLKLIEERDKKAQECKERWAEAHANNCEKCEDCEECC
jgi:hypothetical protein